VSKRKFPLLEVAAPYLHGSTAHLDHSGGR
jgi:hypothetical protein